MTSSPAPTVSLPVRTGTADFRGHQTWYRVTGDLDADAALPPLVVLHGGPGAAHSYCLPMADLAADGRAVVLYDQLGCGNSTHLPDADPSFWNVRLFIDELTNLVAHLGISSFHLLGQSWGGMLGPEFVLAHPDGVLSLSICDSPASMPLWVEAANQLLAQLPQDVQDALSRNEEAGTTESAEYVAAMDVFYAKHVCRVQPLPDYVAASFDQIDAEPTVYHTMNGPSEFHVVGSLKDWSVVDRLGGIAVPTLVVAGAYDEALPLVWAPFVERIPDVRSHVFPDSSHMPHVEEPEAFLDVVGSFLRANDPVTPATPGTTATPAKETSDE